MTDLEITRLCAEAMGIKIKFLPHQDRFYYFSAAYPVDGEPYNPLHDDAQAMALVKKFKLAPVWAEDGELVSCRYPWEAGEYASLFYPNLNRAICECVAKMQQAKNAYPAPKA